MSESKLVSLSWAQIESDAHNLAQSLRHGPPVKGLIAVARGGLVPCGIIARELAVPMQEIWVSTYEGRTPGTPKLKEAPAIPDQGEGWVIVDDLVDHGITAQFVRGMMPRARFVCLYAKPAGRPFADLVMRDFDQNVWIRFPWEAEE